MINEYCFHQWLGSCKKMETAVECGRGCIDYRPVYIKSSRDMLDFQERAKQGDPMALVILGNVPQEVLRE